MRTAFMAFMASMEFKPVSRVSLASIVALALASSAACPGEVFSPDGAAELSADAAGDTAQLDAPANDTAAEAVDSAPAEARGTDRDAVADAVPGDASNLDADADVGGEDAELDLAPDSTPSAACAPGLALSATQTSTTPQTWVVLTATGGTGDYLYSMATAASGGKVNGDSGAYLAGPSVPAADMVRVRDNGCAGEATVTIDVVPKVRLTLGDAQVPVGAAFAVGTVDGIGPFSFELASALGSGGTIDPATGAYQAGNAPGEDLIVVEDMATGDTATALVTVVSGASFTFVGQPEVLLIAQDQRQPVIMSAGTGGWSLTTADPAIASVEDGYVVGEAAGQTTVTVNDSLLGVSASMTVLVGAALAPPDPQVRMGDGTDTAAIEIADVTGDGFADVVVGFGEVDVSAHNSGAAWVYAGTGGIQGLDPSPVQVLSPGLRGDSFGHRVRLADMDGDGINDLIASAPIASAGAQRNGAVFVYRGLAGPTPFEDIPTNTFVGNYSGDNFGRDVVACDFNGDGIPDLAVGAPTAENAAENFSGQGAVALYLGRGQGEFLAVPDQVIYGHQLNASETAFAPKAGLSLGAALAAGDHDGDGVCDLAVYLERYKNTKNNDGAVHVYAGALGTETWIGGLAATPMRAIRAAEADGAQTRIGHSLAMADLDGDGDDELVIGQVNYVTGGRPGAVRLIPGGAAGPSSGWENPPEAWKYVGTSTFGSCGWDVKVDDADNTGAPDVIVSCPTSTQGAGTREGVVAVFHHEASGLPTLPTRTFSGAAGHQRLGGAIAMLPDVDGDGLAELVALAGGDGDLGPDVGRFRLMTSAGTDTPLDMPGTGSGLGFGSSVAFVADAVGSNATDLLVGAPGVVAGPGLQAAGGFTLHAQGATGASQGPSLDGHAVADAKSDDRWGTLVADLGNFGSAGGSYFAVASPQRALTDAPSGWTCGSGGDVGAVAIYDGASPADPKFYAFSVGAKAGVDGIAAADFDGDGRTDLIMGTSSLAGGTLAVYLGRNATGTPQSLCPDFRFDGLDGWDLGASVASLGDLNQDGCDDVVAGAPGMGSDGGVIVAFGAGGGCFNEPKLLALEADYAGGSSVGAAVAGGASLDNDGVPDLVAGGPKADHGDISPGGVWWLAGTILQTMVADSGNHLNNGTAAGPVLSLEGPAGQATRIFGPTHGASFGASLAMVSNVAGGGRALLAVGSPEGSWGGEAESGGVTLHLVDSSGNLLVAPVAVFGGEPQRPRSEAGWSLTASPRSGGSILAVGAPFGNSFGMEQGSVHVFMIPTGLGD